MRSRIVCALAVTAVCLAMATTAQASYPGEVTIDDPFLWLRLDEVVVLNGDNALNSGSTGVGGSYETNALYGDFTDVTSPAGPAKGFNVLDTGPYIQPDIVVQDQDIGDVNGYRTLSAVTVEFLLNPVAKVAEQVIYLTEGTPGNETVVAQIPYGTGHGIQLVTAGEPAVTVDITAAAPTGQWSHVALTSTITDVGGGQVESDIDVYVNGARVGGSEPVWTPILHAPPAQEQGTYNFATIARIGDRYSSGTSSFFGGLDEFAVYDSALSLARIQAHVAEVPDVLASPYHGAVMSDSPFLWMQLNETEVTDGTVAVNAGTTGVNAVYRDTVADVFTDVTSPVGTGKKFNPVTPSILEPDIALPEQGESYKSLTAYSVEFLLNPTEYAGEQMIYGTEGWLANATQVGFGQPGETYGIYTTVAGQPHIVFDISEEAPVGEWSHVVLTNALTDNGDGSTTSDINVYINGVLVSGATPTWNPTAGQGTATFGDIARMGDFWATGTSSFNGGLDEFAVYDSVLSLAAIEAHAAAIVWPDLVPGDTDGDGDVDAADAATLAGHWQQTIAGGYSVGDFNGDGDVDDIDATILATNWTGSSAAVPEPSTATLLLMLGVLGLAMRRRRASAFV